MKTAKALGFQKGDFVFSGAFPGILIGNAHTATPLIEAWGFEHEMGSAYAEHLRKLTFAEFKAMAEQYGFDGTADSKIAQEAINHAK